MTPEQLALRAVSTAIINLRLCKTIELDRKTETMLTDLDDHIFDILVEEIKNELSLSKKEHHSKAEPLA